MTQGVAMDNELAGKCLKSGLHGDGPICAVRPIRQSDHAQPTTQPAILSQFLPIEWVMKTDLTGMWKP